jgi:hypothetical protein
VPCVGFYGTTLSSGARLHHRWGYARSNRAEDEADRDGSFIGTCHQHCCEQRSGAFFDEVSRKEKTLSAKDPRDMTIETSAIAVQP